MQNDQPGRQKMLRLLMINSTVAMKEIYFFIPLPHRLVNTYSICPVIPTLSLFKKISIYLIYLAAPGLGCSMQDLQLWHAYS